MKLNNFNGTVNEIIELNNVLQNNGLNIRDFLNITPKKIISKMWLFVSIGAFVVFNITMVFADSSVNLYLPLTILTITAFGSVLFIIHHNHEKISLTSIVCFVGIIIMVVSFKIMTPKQTIQTVNEKANEYIDNHLINKKDK
jgi:hypothetical protein